MRTVTSLMIHPFSAVAAFSKQLTIDFEETVAKHCASKNKPPVGAALPKIAYRHEAKPPRFPFVRTRGSRNPPLAGNGKGCEEGGPIYFVGVEVTFRVASRASKVSGAILRYARLVCNCSWGRSGEWLLQLLQLFCEWRKRFARAVAVDPTWRCKVLYLFGDEVQLFSIQPHLSLHFTGAIVVDRTCWKTDDFVCSLRF